MTYNINRTVIFLLLLFLFPSCGLMSSSKGDKNETSEMVGTTDASVRESQQIFTTILPQTSENKAFIEEIGYFNHLQVQRYRIFDNNSSLDDFLKELNSSAQALNRSDQKIVNQWITSVGNEYIDANTSNILFLPLLTLKSPLSISIEFLENQAIIKINEELLNAKEKTLYQALFFKIEKSIKEIKINLFGRESVLLNDG